MSDQKLPQKIKKKSNKLKEEDKEKCDNYYLEVNKFIEKNENAFSKKTKEIDYFFEFDEKINCFASDHYDHQNLEAYGYYNKKEKKFYLSIDEAFYLYQIGMITFKEKFDFNEVNLVNLNLYSYLRRSSKIPMVCKLLLLNEKANKKDEKEKELDNTEIEDIDKYLFLFENTDNFKRNKIKNILYQHNSDEKLNFILFKKIFENSRKIYEIFKKINKINDTSDNSLPEILICITQGISLTFLKIDDKIEI